MADVVLAFGAPALADLQDAGVSYTLATDFQLSDALDCVGVEWTVPTTAPGLTSRVSIWDVVGQTELVGKDVDYAGLGGQVVRTTFDAPVALDAATAYRASVLTRERYVATTSYGWPLTTGPITAGTDNGWLAFDTETHTIHYPATESGNNATFHVTPVIDDGTGGGTTVTGTAAAAIAVGATAVGAPKAVGTASAAIVVGATATGVATVYGTAGKAIVVGATAHGTSLTPGAGLGGSLSGPAAVSLAGGATRPAGLNGNVVGR